MFKFVWILWLITYILENNYYNMFENKFFSLCLLRLNFKCATCAMFNKNVDKVIWIYWKMTFRIMVLSLGHKNENVRHKYKFLPKILWKCKNITSEYISQISSFLSYIFLMQYSYRLQIKRKNFEPHLAYAFTVILLNLIFTIKKLKNKFFVCRMYGINFTM